MLIPVQNGQLPQGFCPNDFQTMLNAFSGQQFVDTGSSSSSSGALTQLIISSSTPTAADRDKAWLETDSNGRPIRIYRFAGGAWLSLHPLPPGFTMIYNQVLPNFQTFDGGDASAPPFSDVSGQMWQLMGSTLDGVLVPASTQNIMAARFPVGVGQFPVIVGQTGTGSTVALNGTAGEEKHVLLQTELAPHFHNEKIANNRAVANGGSTDTSGAGGFIGPIADGGTEIFSQVVGGDPATAPSGGVPVSALPHNNLPPYSGVYFLQRTKRLFYVIPG